jgi:hypothetical protein
VSNERHIQDFKLVKRPSAPIVLSERGVDECCCNFIVFASLDSVDNNFNDVTTHYINKIGVSSVVLFQVVKNNTVVITMNNIEIFNSLSVFTSVNWNKIANLSGFGCYSVVTRIDGEIVNTEDFTLKAWSFDAVNKWVRFSAFLGHNSIADGINFRNYPARYDIRIKGFFGKRQPKTKIENLLYSNRIMQSVIRENINEYVFESELTCQTVVDKFIDFVQLSETDLFVTDLSKYASDYNAVNKNVIVSQSAEIVYFDGSLGRKFSIKFEDKKQDKIVKYGNI